MLTAVAFGAFVLFLVIVYLYEGALHKAYLDGYADGQKAAALWARARPSSLTFS